MIDLSAPINHFSDFLTCCWRRWWRLHQSSAPPGGPQGPALAAPTGGAAAGSVRESEEGSTGTPHWWHHHPGTWHHATQPPADPPCGVKWSDDEIFVCFGCFLAFWVQTFRNTDHLFVINQSCYQYQSMDKSKLKQWRSYVVIWRSSERCDHILTLLEWCTPKPRPPAPSRVFPPA